MKSKELAQKLIKDNEGLSSKDASGKDRAYLFPSLASATSPVYAYQDSGGVWTIGWGTIQYANGNRVKQGDCITKAEADNEFNYEFEQKYNAIVAESNRTLTDGQLAALTSFSYNEGTSALFNSTLWHQLQSGNDPNSVALEFDKWVYDNHKKVQGLVNRRNAEKRIFLT